MNTHIVAEIGKNFIHTQEDQSIKEYLANAIELVIEAKQSGADCVKFQCHVFEDEQHKRSEKRYEWIHRNEQATPFEEFWKPLAKFCADNSLDFLVTPMSRLAAYKINPLVKEWKVGSADIVDFELLEYLKSTGKPIIMSSGMSTLEQIDKAVEFLGDSLYVLMHCVSQYPCSLKASNLGTIHFFAKRYPKLLIGYSTHTLSHVDAVGAVYAGATVIEKHFTLNREAFGPDHKVSLLPSEFATMVHKIREAEKLLGVEDKLLLPEETEYWQNFRV